MAANDTVVVPIIRRDGTRYEVLVDAADLELISQHTWHVFPRVMKHGGDLVYVRTNIPIVPPRPSGQRQTDLFMHQLIAGSRVDHINGNGLDNRRANLRLATASQNSANTRRPRSKAGFRGVTPSGAGFVARIVVQGRPIYLGYFTAAVDAARVYDAAALHHFGEFAQINLPQEIAS